MMNNLQCSLANNVLPIRWVLKFDPPILGLVYKRHVKEKKKHIYQIHLNNLIFLSSPEDITQQIFYEHPQYLNPKLVNQQQVLHLVGKLLDYKNKRLQEIADFMNDYDQPDIEYEDDDSDFDNRLDNNKSF